ncbi:hypothetical protein ABH922_002481 [Rhodococcus sp. 27YEA15]
MNPSTSLVSREWGGNRFVERAVTDEVMYKLMKLSGQEYVDIYAASLKKTPSADKASAKDDAAVARLGTDSADTDTVVPDTQAS